MKVPSTCEVVHLLDSSPLMVLQAFKLQLVFILWLQLLLSVFFFLSLLIFYGC